MASYPLLGHRGGFLLLSQPLLNPWTSVYTHFFVISSTFLLKRPSPCSTVQIPSPALPRMPGSHIQLTGQHLHMQHSKGEAHTHRFHNALLLCPSTCSSHSLPHPIPVNTSTPPGAQAQRAESSGAPPDRGNAKAPLTVLSISSLSHPLHRIISYNLMITTVFSPSVPLLPYLLHPAVRTILLKC